MKKRKQKRARQDRTRSRRPAAPPPAVSPRLKGPRLWLFRIATLLLAPALFLLAGEAALRIAGYGYPTSFFLEESATIRTNPDFSRVYFPPAVARVPVSSRLADPKPADTYRVFVLGGSAAQGFPTPSFGFGRILEVMLRERYPGKRFEVVNAALTAVNSHVVLPVARDCARRDADLFVIYAGNNEVVGPFGPGTVFAGFSRNLTFVRASLAAKRTRLGQFVGNLIRRAPTAGWGGMEMFVDKQVAADDPRLASVRDHLSTNLSDIFDLARNERVDVIVSTVATNLGDNPPFASLHRADLAGSDRERWQTLFDRGVADEQAGRCAEAIEHYETAAAIDDRYAELHFRLARCMLSLGDPAAAREGFERARELDALRFRADRGINRAIEEAARGREAQGVYLVDADQVFSTSAWSPNRIPGEALFVDHVHMSFEGNFVLARAIAEKVDEILPAESRGPSAAARELPSLERCAERIGFTDWERAVDLQKIAELIDRPPFTGQYDFAERQAARQRGLQVLLGRISPAALAGFSRILDTAIAESPDDPRLRIDRAELFVHAGDHQSAERELRAALARDPTHREALWQLSQVLASLARLDEEAVVLKDLVEIDGYFAEARSRQAFLLMVQGKPDEAVLSYRELLRDLPGNARARLLLARALAAQGKFDEALPEFREALRADPGLYEALSDLTRHLVARGDTRAAIDACRRNARERPGDAGPRLLLAGLLERAGDSSAAIAAYREATEVDPSSIEARQRYGMQLERIGSPADATAYHRSQLEIDPERPGNHYLLAFALTREGRSEEAIAELRNELDRNPSVRLANVALARILCTDPDPSLRDGPLALALAHRAVILAPDDPVSYDTLAAAYAETGDFDLAVEAEMKAIRLAGVKGGREASRVRGYQGRLERYRAGQPVRAPKAPAR